MSKKGDKAEESGLELQDVQDRETKPSTSKLQSSCSATEKYEVDNHSESSATQDKDSEKAPAEETKIYRHVPPDPPPPIFVEVNYDKNIPKTKLKRSVTYIKNVTKILPERNEQLVTTNTQERVCSNQGPMQHHVKSRMKVSVSNPEIISWAASSKMANVRRSSILDMFRMNTPSPSNSGYANHASVDNQVEILWLTQQEDLQNGYNSNDNVEKKVCPSKESCATRICHTCDGSGKLPMAGKSDMATQWPEEIKEAEKNRKPPERRHSTGNMLGVDSAIMTAMIERAEAHQYQPPTQSTAVKCIQYFLAFLYYVGMSPIKPASAKQLPKWFLSLQLAYFTLFASISIFQALADVKYTWLGFTFDKNFMAFLKFGFLTGNCLARIYNIHTLISSAEETSVLLEKIDAVNSMGSTNNNYNHTRALAISIGIISMFLIAFDTIFGSIAFNKWNPKDAILYESVDMSELLFLWTSKNYSGQIDRLYDQYGAELTPTTWMLGLFGKFVTYCGVLHGCMMLDLWPIIALQIILLHSHFHAKMEETKNLTKEKRKGRCPLSINWDYYFALREVCDQNHHVFGKFLKVIHLQNILQMGYFLMQLIKTDTVNASVLVDTFSVLKVSATYFIVQKSADKNEQYEDCVIQCAERRPTIEMGGTEVSVVVLIKDMKKHPIAVGRGDFVVNEAFVLKVACFVGSLFVLLSDSDCCANKQA